MNELIQIYEKNKDKIEEFLKETILNNFNNLSNFEKTNFKDLYDNFKSLELVYIVDKNSKIQTSPNIYRNKIDENEKNKSRKYLFGKIDENEKISVTNPYKSTATGNICITMSINEGNKFIFLDFNLKKLLERLKLLQTHDFFDTTTKIFYALSGFLMIIFSFLLIVYSAFETVYKIGTFGIMNLFKPIIYITIAVAIFDLAKTLLEQEVFFKSYKKDENVERKTFIKFVISILIALCIEALMLVFKISLNNIDKMINALYLFIGISLIIISMSVFIKISKK